MWIYDPESREGGLILLILALPIFLASDPEGRRIVGVLTRANAIAPDSAMNAYELAADESSTLRRLINEGTVSETLDRRYFVNPSAVPRFRHKRVLAASAVTLVVGAGLVVGVPTLFR